MIKTLHILTIIAFMAGIIAPACGFAWGGKYSVIEICTDQGIESRIVAENETPSDEAPMAKDQCQFCFANAHINALIPASHVDIARENHALSLQFALYEAMLLSRLTSHEQPRGPPNFV